VTLFAVPPFAAAGFAYVVALVSLARSDRSPATWCFGAGMTALALDSCFTGLGLSAPHPSGAVDWLTRSFVVKSFLPVIWLAFSLTYSRGDGREHLSRWRIPLAIAAVLPVLSFAVRTQLFQLIPVDTPTDGWRIQQSAMAKALNGAFLVSFALVLMNLEQTFRSAVGTMRWRIKYVVLGLAVIFGTSTYIRGQSILFPVLDPALLEIESGALLIGCVCLAIAYVRAGLTGVDVYPSRAILRSSLAAIIVGSYLFLVGILAQVVRRFGGAEIFQFQAYVVLLGMTGLAILLLSDRAKRKVDVFVASHFKKAQHDSVRIWSVFSQRLAGANSSAGVCAVCVRVISETFGVLSVTAWVQDEEQGRLVAAASTGRSASAASGNASPTVSGDVAAGLQTRSSPFDLEGVSDAWAEQLRQLNPTTFSEGGNRFCVPLKAGDRAIGAVVLADRIGSAVYTPEDLELLKCIGDQMSAALVNLRLASEVACARELDAFRTMSAFFVHDLKNAAAALNLMLKNLPVHFNEPTFRDDALRGIGNAARRIDEMIGRLTALRQRPDITRQEADLNQLVIQALDHVTGMANVELVKELQPLAKIVADGEQIQSVVTNLVLNARDALDSGGRIQVCTRQEDGHVVLSIADNGCGMKQEFVNERLFRPFQSTKPKGLGVGLFQSRSIVQAHGGGMHVESEIGKGTTFRVTLPIKDAR
jgi:putative PEP-CTERM system histidine kinase